MHPALIYFIGLLFLSGSIGCLWGSAFGSMAFGIGLMFVAFIRYVYSVF